MVETGITTLGHKQFSFISFEGTRTMLVEKCMG